MENNKCLIYCRVSSERQVVEGNGLGSQEKRCRDYAKNKKYLILKVFPDKGVSGGLFERPAMRKLIEYLDAHPLDKFIIIFDDFSRFSRDMKVHIQLKTELESRGAKLECLNFAIDDSEESEFAELILAASNQYQRKSNRRQVIQKQKARLESGYWAFSPPLALVSKRDPLQGKVLVSNEPYAGIYKQAIELFADETLLTIESVKQFVNKKFESIRVKRRLSFNGARMILTQILYAGYVEYKPWGVTRRKGRHEGFVSIETYNKVQNRLSGNKRHGVRKDYDPNFPLRQLTLCSKCHGALTGSWNKGRSKHYANYACKTEGCPYRYKVIHKDKIEEDFENLLSNSKPALGVTNLVKAVLNDTWTQRKACREEVLEENRKRREEINHSLESLKTRLVKTSDETMLSVYEDEIKKMIIEKENIENIEVEEYSDSEFGTATDLVLKTLENPMVLWKSDNGEDKRTIFNMYFGKKLIYDKVSGFGTVKFDPVIGLITSPTGIMSNLVETEGVEPSSKR